MRRSLVVVELVALAITLVGCGSRGSERGDDPVRIVHAVLPTTIVPSQPADGAAASAPGEDALRALIRWAGSGENGDAEALVVVGNFESSGVDAAAGAKRLVDVLRLAPSALPIYVVPGTRELKAEELPSAALVSARAVIQAAQKELQGTAGGARITDLSSCYATPASGPASCVAQVPGRRVRLVGYPGYYLGSSPAKGAAEEQQKWIASFQQAMGAQQDGFTTVLVAPLATPVARHWASETARTTWMQSARTAQVALGVDGGGAMRRALYNTGERWTENGLEGSWFLTPPLVIPGASENRPAQGASVISVATGGAVGRQVFWYTPLASAFRGSLEVTPGTAAVQNPFDPSWLWGLGESLHPLPKASVFFIALLAAFLTSVAVWQIPPAASNVTVTATTPATAGQTTPTTTIAIPQSLMDKWAPASFIQQNFARTVLSGLGGLAVATLTLEAVGQTDKAPAQAFYLVWFIVWFFVFLFASAIARGVTEGLRAVSYVGRQKPVSTRAWSLPKLWIGWFLLTAGDTFWNLIQGKNELKSTIWADEIRSNQEDSLVAIDRVAEHLRAALVEYLTAKTGAAVDLADIRVAVSVLADDGKRVYYVSWPPESSSKEFGTRSIAYIAVAASLTRWWASEYETQSPPVILFDNKAGELPLDKKDLPLPDYFESRGRDYSSFMLFPVPSRPTVIGRRAGLHISFKEAAWVSTVWPKAVLGANVPKTYDMHAEILDNTPPELNRLLRQSIHVIESVLRSFNENVFEKDLRSRRRA